jgi:hypothetical protein
MQQLVPAHSGDESGWGDSLRSAHVHVCWPRCMIVLALALKSGATRDYLISLLLTLFLFVKSACSRGYSFLIKKSSCVGIVKKNLNFCISRAYVQHNLMNIL